MSEWAVPFDKASVKDLEDAMSDADRMEQASRFRGTIMGLVLKRFKGLKVEIYANEHPPPHFHVKTSEGSASFSIDDCLPLEGDRIILRRHREISRWHQSNRDALIETWNTTRPSDCPVGEFRD